MNIVMHIKTGLSKRFFVALFAAASASCLYSIAPVFADFLQGYNAEGELPQGVIVSMSEEGGPRYVVPANSGNANRLFGVVSLEEDASVYFSRGDGDEDSEVAVATSGDVYALVSDLNGDINAGDRIAPSDVEGVGAKAISTGFVIGVAQESFSGDGAEDAIRIEVETPQGPRDVFVGKILITAGVDTYRSSDQDKDIFDTLQGTAEVIAGRPVSLARALIAFGILIATLLVVAIVLGSTIQGSMVSLGRNPLAKKTIISSMVRVILFGIVVLSVGATAAYLALIS